MNKCDRRYEDCFEDFEIYLKSIDKLSIGSKSSYVDYLHSLCKHTLDCFSQGFCVNETENLSFIELFYAIKKNRKRKLLVLAECYLNELKENNTTSLSMKTLSNYFSSFKWFMYMTFETEIKTKNIKKIDKNVLKSIEDEIERRYAFIDRIIYSKKKINDIYIARLKTQDREYEEINFPIRVIWKLAKRETIEKQLLKSMQNRIDEMIYFVSKDGKKTITHKQIREFVLNIKDDCVNINGEKMFTEKYIEKRGQNKEYIKQRPIMAQISIDHKEDLNGMLTGENVVRYPNLKRLSDDMKAFSYGEKKTKAVKSVEFFNANHTNYDKDFVKALISEICSLFDAMQFVAMDKNQNSSKNAEKVREP